MKALLLFLACFLPLAIGLWLLSDEKRSSALPDEASPATAEAMLTGADFAGPYGVAPFRGKLRQLENFDLRIVDDGYFKFYFQIGRLGRTAEGPRLEEVRAAIFDPPEGGRPRLRLTLAAPRIAGELKTLLHAPDGAARIVTLDGGVVARDPAGRLVAKVPRLDLDLAARTVSSKEPVVLRLPDRDAEVSGTGFFADLEQRRARLDREVTASVRSAGHIVRLTCAGPATLREIDRGGDVEILLENDARLEHELGSAACRRIRARFAPRAEGTPLRRARLEGGLRLRLDPAFGRGLDQIEMEAATILGEERVDCEGPLKAVWRGTVMALGLGERTLDIEAGGAVLLLRRGEQQRLELEEGRFLSGLKATDRGGAGFLKARTLTFAREGSVLEADGDVEAKTPDGHLTADHLRLAAAGPGRYEAVLKGEKRIAYVADGRLGPFGEAARGTLLLTSRGPLTLSGQDQTIRFEARDAVIARIDDLSRLECGRLVAVQKAGRLESFLAEGGVVLVAKQRGAEARGDRIDYRDGVARLAGSPATVRLGEVNKVQAKLLVYRDDQSFRAEGGVEVVGRLGKKGDPGGKGHLGESGQAGGTWHLRGGQARGRLTAEGGAERIEVTGGVSADGPAGEHVRGDSFEYDAATGRALLLGKPAVLRRGDDVTLRAAGFDLTLDGGAVTVAQSRGPAELEYLPRATGATGAFKRWRVDLGGPATLKGDELIVEKGGRLEAYDADDRLALTARAGRVAITLAREGTRLTARELRGDRGVIVESTGEKGAKVSARRLVFLAGTRQVDLYGDARVEAKGWQRKVRFQHVVFTIEENGIDLKRASRIEIK